MTPYHESDGVTLYHGDCLQVLRTLPAESVDAVVSDPPYGLSFMGKRWDYDVPAVEVWAECLRVLKPGGHLLAFAGTRTQHRMAVRIEDAGFEIRDMIAWLYGSGFPKSLDVSKAIDKANGRRFEDRYALGQHIRQRREACKLSRSEVNAWLGSSTKCEHYESRSDGFARVPTLADWRILKERLGLSDEWSELIERVEAEREVVGRSENGIAGGSGKHAGQEAAYGFAGEFNITAPATPEAQRWQGWGTALKPSWECITVARKPLIGTVAENVLQHGTGALNVDGCRVACSDESLRGGGVGTRSDGWDRPWKNDPEAVAAHKAKCDANADRAAASGRWPANLIHDGSDEVTGLFPETASGTANGNRAESLNNSMSGKNYARITTNGRPRSCGSAARFFYCAKASKRDRGETNKHPTVKPTALMRYLCKLITPPGGLVLDPFTGSGSTGRGAVLEGFRFVGMELDAEHAAEAKRRILEAQNGWTDEPEDESVEDLPGQRLLF